MSSGKGDNQRRLLWKSPSISPLTDHCTRFGSVCRNDIVDRHCIEAPAAKYSSCRVFHVSRAIKYGGGNSSRFDAASAERRTSVVVRGHLLDKCRILVRFDPRRWMVYFSYRKSYEGLGHEANVNARISVANLWETAIKRTEKWSK